MLTIETDERPEAKFRSEPEPFEALRHPDTLLAPTPEEIAFYGLLRITRQRLVPIPPDVPETHTLTNPSEVYAIDINGEMRNIFYARFEPIGEHIGKTFAKPYFLMEDAAGNPYLEPCDATIAMEVPGEDPRVTRGVKRLMPNGSYEEGWLVSTILADPDPDNLYEAKRIRQQFYWGRSLAELELIAEGPDGYKNTSVAPMFDDTIVFPRPQPEGFSGNIAYTRLNDISELSPEIITAAKFINENLLPVGSGVWGGVNAVLIHDEEHVELFVHEACSIPGSDNREGRHYRLARYGFNPQNGRIVRLGVYATRDDFPASEHKPNPIDLYEVLFGAVSFTGADRNHGILLAGVSDRFIGIADIERVPAPLAEINSAN